MKKFLLSLAVLATAVTVSAQFTAVPDGGFDAGIGSWINDGPATFSYPATGGNPGGYASVDATGGNWGVLVQDADLFTDLGVAAGDTITVSFDMFGVAGGELAGLKIESWNGTGFLDNGAGDQKSTITTTWTTYTFDYTINAAATFLKFVPLSVDGGNVGFDNVGIITVPEPSTFAFIGGFIALGFVMYRRRKQA